MSKRRRNCWSCDYDMSMIPTSTCPECGSDANKPPQISRLRHNGGMFFATNGFFAIGAIGFVRFVLSAKQGAPSRYDWIDLGVLVLFACAPAAYALRLLFFPPHNASDRSTSRTALLILCVTALAVTMWLRWW